MNFDEDEIVLFKHRATLNKVEREGDLIATSKRLAYRPDTASDPGFDAPWANVGTVKYTPLDDPKERVWVMVSTVVAGGSDGGGAADAKTIKLTGASLASRRKELERLKGIVSDVRKGVLAPFATPIVFIDSQHLRVSAV